MDIPLKPKHWTVRYKAYILGGTALVALLIYTLVLQFQPERRRVPSASALGISEAVVGEFREYVEQEGVVQPMLTLTVNTRIGGFVERIVAEEGTLVRQGDTLLVLSNPELLDEVEQKKTALQKQLMTYREQEITAAQQSIRLRQQVLQNRYELQRLAENYALSEEEYRMGVKSKAELEMARKEYEYKTEAARLEQESLHQDSAAAVVRAQLIAAGRAQELRLFDYASGKRDLLVVRAPISGQLSSLQVAPGQQVGAGMAVGELKDLDNYKVSITLGEYYIDRVQSGLPAKARYKGKDYPMAVRRVIPEVKNRSFSAELVFAEGRPDALRLGQTLSTQVQLGNSEEVLTIPRGDFYAATGGQWIFRVVPGENRAERVPIRLGRQNPRHYEVVEGLSPGDRVLTTGYSRYKDAEELTWSE